jgi:hypothetical protein
MNAKSNGQRKVNLDRGGNARKEGGRLWCGGENSSHHHNETYILVVRNLDLGSERSGSCVCVREKAEKKILEKEVLMMLTRQIIKGGKWCYSDIYEYLEGKKKHR